MPTAADIHYAKQSEAMGGDGNCHLHIGKTIDLTRCSFGCGRRQRLAAARDDIYTLYVHNIISVLQVQLLGVKCT